MFDMGWSELLIVGVVALIVVGPKDLPKMFRTLGQITGKARGMAREFQRAMDAAADDAGVKDVAKTLRDTASGKSLRDAVGFDEIDKEFRDIRSKVDPAGGRSIAGKPGVKPAATASNTPVSSPVSSPASDAAAAEPGNDLAARNAATMATDAERLKRAERAAAARAQAAEARARREAQAAAPDAAGPDASAVPPPATEPPRA